MSNKEEYKRRNEESALSMSFPDPSKSRTGQIDKFEPNTKNMNKIEMSSLGESNDSINSYGNFFGI